MAPWEAASVPDQVVLLADKAGAWAEVQVAAALAAVSVEDKAAASAAEWTAEV